MKRARGTMILDLLVGLGLLSVLAVAAGHVVWRSFQVVRAQALSADIVSQEREALALLSRDLGDAEAVTCSADKLTLVLPGGARVTYADERAGLLRSERRAKPHRWPRVRAEFARASPELTEIRLEGGDDDDVPPLVCETAVWARAAGRR